MGMAIIQEREYYPLFKGAVICKVCGAQYSGNQKWIRVLDVTPRFSTCSPEYVKIGDVTHDGCPFCGARKKEQVYCE